MRSAEVAAAVAPQPFDLLGPLPEGTTVLEASAGTGCWPGSTWSR